ncbi:hypothetical protein [Streptomyces sp. NPDC046859]|uniref:hypothetical protein n=1 Tax=Streptomyces sp. NPDC046859 TaxID=3155734 RepID=UPI0033C7EFCA
MLQSTAAIIGALAGVVGALFGFLALPAAGVRSPAGAMPTQTVTATVTMTPPGHPSGSTPSSSPGSNASPSKADAVRWKGRLLVEQDRFALDQVPPAPTIGITDLVAQVTDTGDGIEFYEGESALVPQGEEPSSKTCWTLARTQAQTGLVTPTGKSACLITEEGRAALVKVVSVRAGVAQVDVTVWEERF